MHPIRIAAEKLYLAKKITLSESKERGCQQTNIFHEIRDRVYMQDVVKFYGLQLSRSGMACCPFHEDRTPSLKVYEDHFYCFGCGTTGDCTGFVSKLFGISQLEAAKKINHDFGLNLFNGKIAVPVQTEVSSETEYFMWLKKAEKTVTEYLDKLCGWRKKYAPRKVGEQLEPLFVESLQNISYIEYLSEILSYGSDKEKRQLYISCREDIMKIRERFDKLAVAERTVKRKAI